MFNSFEDFNDILLTKRNSGSIICSFKSINNLGNEITKEEFLEEIGHQSNEIKGRWEVIDKRMAKKILEYILSMDMAYDIDLETKPLAEKLSNYFLKEFLSDAKYYTNGKFDEVDGFFRLSEWTSITNSTFDTGILAIDKNKIGILWAEDND
ncbi:hypothetical protein [Bacillus cereus group sp. BfR-BA-01380]|uniref:hypothetical protein n=1 Tax=Bacillus cereus group sp. BfR-BA-01380 TaxID=2920324 RepID=UPI001F59B01B|nr:hypothetical protein [Bacillus cereus group sp. BfR-BA-01380]